MSQQGADDVVGFDDYARDRVRDLGRPDPKIFWKDLLSTAAVGWGAFYGAITLDPFARPFAALVAVLAVYRGLCFMHELTHIRAKALPGFETAWNLLFGVPLLLPSFVYVGVHQDHHNISTYGTKRDPEYMPFARSDLMMIVFIAHSVLIPAFLLVRFMLLAPVGLLSPAVYRWLAVHASALSMSPAYKRDLSRGIRSRRIWEVITFTTWLCVFTGLFTGAISWHVLLTWYAVMAAVCVINTLRALGAHAYESDGAPMARTEQLLDSINTPGAVLTELWAPVGLRYHALHHYFPGIPYHNLGEAHRRLAGELPSGAPYHQTFSSGLLTSLKHLYQRGRATRQPR